MKPSKYPIGLYSNIPAPDYHASGGVSITTLKAYANSAEHGKAFEDGIVKIGEEAAFFGEAFHCLVLQPHLFASQYVCKPQGMNFSTSVGKEWRFAQMAKIVSFDDWTDFKGMSARAYSDPIAGPYLRAKGRCELSAFSLDEETGISTRARFDKLTDEHVIIDIKTTQSARPHEFTRQCATLRYHLQAWWYQNILRNLDQPSHGFVLIAIEKTAPYSVQCFEFDAEAMEHAKNECARLLKLYQKCHEEKRWPGYVDQDSPYLIKMPKWALEARDAQDQVEYPMGEVSL